MFDAARAQAYLDRLAAELEARGLKVAAKLPALTATNPGAAGRDAQGKAMSPGLKQSVLIREYEGAGLTWCWVFEALRSAERGVPTAPPEVEPMCPAGEITRAADLIANVIRLRDTEPAGGLGEV
jgi:hypothetical protein